MASLTCDHPECDTRSACFRLGDCPWCVDPASDEDAPERLCRPHLAEYEGLSLAELDRMDAEQASEWREWAGA